MHSALLLQVRFLWLIGWGMQEPRLGDYGNYLWNCFITINTHAQLTYVSDLNSHLLMLFTDYLSLNTTVSLGYSYVVMDKSICPLSMLSSNSRSWRISFLTLSCNIYSIIIRVQNCLKSDRRSRKRTLYQMRESGTSSVK